MNANQVVPKQLLVHDGRLKHLHFAGYNSNLDLIVKAVDTLTELNLTTSLGLSEYQDHEKLSTLSEFYQTFMHFFDKGSAAERFVSDKNVWNEIVEASKRATNQHWFIGGNAALMGNRFAKVCFLTTMYLTFYPGGLHCSSWGCCGF